MVKRHSVDRGWYAWLALLVALYLHNTLPYLTMLPRVNVDEPWLIERADQLLLTGSTRQPMFMLEHAYLLQPGYPLLLAAWLKPLGIGIAQARLLSVVLGLGTVLLTCGIGRALASPPVGLVAATLLSTDSNFLGGVRLARTDAPAVFFAALALYLCLRARETDRPWRWTASGVSSGAAILCHGNAYWVVVVVVAWLVVMFGRRFFLAAGYLYVSGLILALAPYGAIVMVNRAEFFDQWSIFAPERLPGLGLATIAHNLIAEPSRYRGWSFGLVTDARLSPLLLFFQAATVIGFISLLVRLYGQVRRHAVSPEDLALLTLSGGSAVIFAGFIPNKALVYLPHVLIGFALVAAVGVTDALGCLPFRRTVRGVSPPIAMLLVALSAGGFVFYERWFASTQQSGLKPFAETAGTLTALVPPGPKYLVGSPTFWLPFRDEPGVRFIAYTAAGPYTDRRPERRMGRHNLLDLPRDRPLFLLVDREEFGTALGDHSGQWFDEVQQSSWSRFVTERCALYSVALQTAHGSLRVFRCSYEGPPPRLIPELVQDSRRFRIGPSVSAVDVNGLAGWKLWSSKTTVGREGPWLHISSPESGGIFGDLTPPLPGHYLLRVDVAGSEASATASVHSVSPNGALIGSRWFALSPVVGTEVWMPVDADTTSMRVYLYSDRHLNLRVRIVQLDQLEEVSS